MSKTKRSWYTVRTNAGRATYRLRVRAESAARWVATTTGETVIIVNESTGERWEVAKD